MIVETVKDFLPGPVGVQRRWMQEINTAGKWQDKWEKTSREIIRRYDGDLAEDSSSSFNILHSNTETLRPTLFGQTPQPDIRRRTKMPGVADRTASEVLERGIRYMNDSAPYEENVNMGISDYLLTGRMTCRVRYIPTVVQRQEQVTRIQGEDDEQARFFTANMNEVDPADVVEDEDGAALINIEELKFERADVEHVPYCDFRHTPGKRWTDVRWVAFRHLFDRTELRDSFGNGIANKTQLTINVGSESQKSDTSPEPDIFMKAEVWEIWDKTERQILFVSDGYAEGPLATFQDGPEFYNLRDFFPTVEPLRSIITPTSLLPIPEFIIYQDLADELDEITSKIRNIVDTIDVKGAYDAELSELGLIYDNRNRLTPVEDWRALTDKGGLAGVMDFVPIDPQVKAFVALTEQRDQLLNTIYQTIGISDIARGQSDPRETATAQRLKGNFGSARMAPRQRGVQRYLRDLMRLQSELMAEKFETTTLTMMTGIEIEPEVEALLRLDALRNFAVDIETDSTIAADEQAQRADVAEMLEGLAGFANAAQGLPEGARLPLLQSVVRKFKLGRDVELAIEEAAQQEPEPDPEAMKVQAETQQSQQELALKAQDSERDFEIAAEQLALKARELGLREDEAEARTVQAMAQLFSGNAT